MAWQLIYTSAPRLLDAGRSGFGTVARHREIPPLLVQAVERASQFARLPGMDANRVIYSHRTIQAGGNRHHVLSMIQSAGSDYTGRTNHIAHHLIATEREAAEAASAGLTPADVLLCYYWRKAWEDAPQWLQLTDLVPLTSVRPADLPFSTWATFTGNADHARLLGNHAVGKSCYLAAPQGTDFRLLFLESLRSMPSNRWQPTFTTSQEPTDEAGDFRWIGTIANASALATAEAAGRPFLDLTKPETLPVPEIPRPSAVVELAAVPTASTPYRETSPATLGDHAAPFVERDMAPMAEHTTPAKGPVNPPSIGPIQVPMPTSPWLVEGKTSRARLGKTKGRDNTGLVLAAAVVVLVMLGALYMRWADKRGPDDGKGSRQAAAGKGAPEKSQVLSWLDDKSYFNEQTAADIVDLNLKAGTQAYCRYANDLLASYKEGDFAKALTTEVDDTEVPRVSKLRAVRTDLQKIVDAAIPEAEIKLGELSELMRKWTEERITQISTATDNFRNSLNADLPNTWGPNMDHVRQQVSEKIKGLVSIKLKFQLIKARDDNKLASKDADTWKAVLEKTGIESPFLNDLLTKQAVAVANGPNGSASQEIPPLTPPAPQVTYYLANDIQRLDELGVPCTEAAKFTLFGSKNEGEILTYFKGRGWFGKEADNGDQGWLRVSDGKLALAPNAPEQIKEVHAILLDDGAKHLQLSFLQSGKAGARDNKAVLLKDEPVFTVEKDGTVSSDLWSRLLVKIPETRLQLRLTERLGFRVGRYAPPHFDLDGNHKLKSDTLRDQLRAVVATSGKESTAAAQKNLEDGIKADKDRIKQLETLNNDSKQLANKQVHKEELQRINEDLPIKEKKLKALKEAPQGSPADDARELLKHPLFQPHDTGGQYTAEEKAQLYLISGSGNPGSSSGEQLLCNVILKFKE